MKYFLAIVFLIWLQTLSGCGKAPAVNVDEFCAVQEQYAFTHNGTPETVLFDETATIYRYSSFQLVFDVENNQCATHLQSL
jgi:hypothetical protein